MTDAKKAAFEQQFECSGPKSPPREKKVRAAVDAAAALEKYTSGGVNFKLMSSPEMFAIIEHLKQLHGGPAEELEKNLLKVRSQADRKMTIVDFATAHKPAAPLADRSNRPSTAPPPTKPAARAQAEAFAPPAAAAPAAPAAPRGRWRAERCSVGAEGNCSRTQLPMRAVEISAEARAELRAIIPRLAGSRAKGAEFASFGAWVDEQGPFEYVLDGANIGFFGQGKVAKTHKAAAFSYEQVDAVLRCVCARSERVLLVLHVSHTEDASLGLDALKLVRAWRERGLLFSSPTKHNDDWYWLYAAMASGERCKVVSNDEMRDHHFGMLSPRSFLRWKERHVVHFNFCKKKQNLEPELEYPPAYSIAVQDHPTPGHPGRSWLFPCSEPAGGKEGGAREWLLVRPAEAVEAEAGEAEGVSAAAKETVAAAIS